MTTGRINQVTILQAGPSREPKLTHTATATRPSRRRVEVSDNQVGAVSTKVKTRPTGDRTTPVRGRPSTAAIQLPPLSSPRGGPPQHLVRCPEATTTRL